MGRIMWRPDRPLAGIYGANTLFNEFFFGFATADPHVALRRRASIIQGEREYAQRARVTWIEQCRLGTAEIGQASLIARTIVEFVVIPNGPNALVICVRINVKVEPNIRVLGFRSVKLRKHTKQKIPWNVWTGLMSSVG